MNTRVVELAPHSVVLACGRTLKARLVIDGRGGDEALSYVSGYQKFLGLHLHLAKPHGLAHPTIMDATVSQKDGYRFHYLLPWSAQEIFVENTYYSSSSTLDFKTAEAEIMAYANLRGWDVVAVDGREHGVLPIPLAGRGGPRFQSGIVAAGMRSGRYHPTTGYSIGAAASFADRIANLECFDADQADLLNAESQEFWRRGDFFRRLNNMLFLAAQPAARWKIMESFYRRDAALIRRFYSGDLKASDRFRIVSGKPPVAVLRGLKAFLERVDQ